MITTTLEFYTVEEAQAAFERAEAAYALGYGFYPKSVPADMQAELNQYLRIHDDGLVSFTYSRGESCD